MERIGVAVLGATGIVGQRFIARLAEHPRFEIQALTASGRSAGLPYREACTWRAGGRPYAGLGDRIVEETSPERAWAPIVFSALDAQAASEIEPLYAASGALVFSNASAYRMHEDVPLLVPEANADHLALLEEQRRRRRWRGGIACNPNCTTAILTTALAPLHRTFGIEAALVTSMQAVSGAGYPGVSALDISGNLIPFIRGEEEKLETETAKILGTLFGGRVEPAPFPVSATCTRVPVRDGHSISASLRLRGNPSVEEVVGCLKAYRSPLADLGLPSAPEYPVSVHEEPDRPQPLLDADTGDGMTVSVGRFRSCGILGLKFLALGHNLERGAAGAAVLNAELYVSAGVPA
ncbi:MAG: aspartate-semialdehyde dehydrogenase [Treponema sp.]|nr:aspartate-semialdehyde dehydrogenase [Treponema sp.]